jgi:predicted dehydrogenase
MMKKDVSRRKFLQQTAGAASVLAASKGLFLRDERLEAASYPPVPPSDRLRFGIIGIGMQGSGLLNAAVSLPGAECVAACDLYDGRHTLAQEITGKPNLPTTRRYKELLDNKEIDCLIAAVPDHWHKQVVVDAVHAGKDIYCEKPMSHTPADGVEMVKAGKATGRVIQIGSQRVSSVLCAKAKELIANGTIGDLMMVEGSLGRNDPTGAWEYPPPFDLSPKTLDWETWQGDAPHRPWDQETSPKYFARWRCWKEYGTGVAGDLLVHLVSGFMFMAGINQPPTRVMSMGGIRRWKDGRNMPDVHATLFDYGDLPVYFRLNLGTENPENYRFAGSKGILEVTETALTYYPQTGKDEAPSYYASGFPNAMRNEYFAKWHAEHDPAPAKEPGLQGLTFRSVSWDEQKPHMWTYFQAVRTRQPNVEDVVFGHNAALACHLANESYFKKSAVVWDAASEKIKTV